MQFNENERKLINTYVKDFSIANASNILEFGRIIESKISIINDVVLNKTKSKETSRIEELFKTITNEILKINQTQKKLPWYKKLLGYTEEETEKPNYDLMIDCIDNLIVELRKSTITIQKDLQLIELLNANSTEYLHELDMYLLSGDLILKKANNDAINAKNKKDELLYNDLMNAISNFEKRLHDLRLMRQITVQSIPQMNMVRDNNYFLIDRINYLINTTIPLWKSQILIIMSTENAEKSSELSREVSMKINEVLTNNSSGLIEMSQRARDELKNGSVSEKTLVETSKLIISSLSEISNIDLEKESNEKNIELKL